MNEHAVRLATALGAAAMMTACAAPVPGPAPAQSDAASSAAAGPAPGRWQLVLEVENLPGAARVPAQTMTLCSTPEDKKQWLEMVGGKTAAGCSVKDYAASGSTISYRMQCSGGIEGATTIRIADIDHYSGESRLTLQGGAGGAQPPTIRSKVTATRVAAECSK
jgi:hypothetical protein